MHHNGWNVCCLKNTICAVNQQTTHGFWKLDGGRGSDSIHYHSQ